MILTVLVLLPVLMLGLFVCAFSFSPLCDLNVNFTFNRAWNRCPVTETYWLIYAAAKVVINDHVGYYFQSLR